jgi:transposase
MRAGISITVTPEDRLRLEVIVRDRNAKQKHVKRAKVILATADGCGTNEIMRRSGLSKPVVWRWQERFMREGVDGLTRDKTRKPGKKPLPAASVQRVVDLALGPAPGESTHWTGRMLAKASGVSLRSVQRILDANQLEQFLCSFPTCLGIALGPNREKELHQIVWRLRAFEIDAKVECFVELADRNHAQIFRQHWIANGCVRFAKDSVEHCFECRVRFLPWQTRERFEIGRLQVVPTGDRGGGQ